ncbi:HRDC domain-containing protein [uncultured Marinobacter sp.]|uniref:ribonuclease D n=1 Tax=uncultured Marinobacter sp. TaxID=187379 RepID=UPI0030D8D932
MSFDQTIVSPEVPPVPAAGRPQWLTSSAELDDWLTAHSEEPLALDTEFERVSTFYPIPGLVQLGAGDSLRLADPDVAAGSRVFRQVMTDPERPKLLYAMGEDLELFRHWLELEPQGLLDLQLGAALAGEGFSMGYARLVEQVFGEVLDKSATRSDWISRPLSAAQERYALDDIRFLGPLFVWLLAKLDARQLTDALVEESERFASDQLAQSRPEDYYLKVRGGWHLSPMQQGVLKALVIWRETESRRRDKPRSRVLADPVLIAIAEKLPETATALAAVEDMPPPVARRNSDVLLAIVAEARSAEEVADPLIERPLTRPQQDQYRKVKKLLGKVAEQYEIPVELLAPRRRLEAIVRSGDQNDQGWQIFVSGWRGRLTEAVMKDIRAILTP